MICITSKAVEYFGHHSDATNHTWVGVTFVIGYSIGLDQASLFVGQALILNQVLIIYPVCSGTKTCWKIKSLCFIKPVAYDGEGTNISKQWGISNHLLPVEMSHWTSLNLDSVPLLSSSTPQNLVTLTSGGLVLRRKHDNKLKLRWIYGRTDGQICAKYHYTVTESSWLLYPEQFHRTYQEKG